MTLLDIPAPVEIPSAIPVSNAFSTWTEYCLMSDLELPNYACPTCNKDIPSNFMMFRPHGLEYWRCLMCLAKTHYGSPLHVSRTTATGDDEAPF
jgi:hypothetical protein